MDTVFESNKKESDEKINKDYLDIKKIDNFSFKSKHSFLADFFNDLNKFSRVKTKKRKTQRNKRKKTNAASELYNDLLEIYFDKCYNLSGTKRKKMHPIMVLLI